jgi:hypothetical protein
MATKAEIAARREELIDLLAKGPATVAFIQYALRKHSAQGLKRDVTELERAGRLRTILVRDAVDKLGGRRAEQQKTVAHLTSKEWKRRQ